MGGGIGGLLNLKQGGADYAYLYDGKGNVTAVLDSGQNVVASYSYDAFGKLMTKTGTLDQPIMFSTKRYDEKTGLSYYGFRYYSPSIARWNTRDPIGEAGGMNLYAHTFNNPIRYIDPFGLYVTMVCRPLPGILGALGYKHCFVTVWHKDKCGNRVIDNQYSVTKGGKSPLPQGSEDPTFGTDTDAFNNPGGSNEHFPIPPPSGMSQDDFDRAVTGVGDSYYSQGPYDPYNGPNSNTATDNIIGGTAPDVPGAQGQNQGEIWHDIIRMPF